MPLSQEERRLLHQKSKQATFGTQPPQQHEGKDGDRTYRDLAGTGTVMYYKRGDNWVPMSSTDKMPVQRIITSGGGVGGGAGVTAHGDLTGLNSDHHVAYILVDGTRAFTGAVTVGTDGAGHDVTFHSDTAGDSFFWDSSDEKLVITGTDGQFSFVVEDGDAQVKDKLYFWNNANEYIEGDGTDLTINAGTAINLKANIIDIGKNNDADVLLQFLGDSGNGVLRWMEDQDYFKFSDSVLIEGNEKLYLNSTSAYVYSEAGGYVGSYPKLHIASSGASPYVTSYAVNIEPQTSGRHLTSGEADYQENYSWLSLYLLQSDVTTYDNSFGNW